MSKSDLPERFREYIDREKLILPGQTIVIGLSGGADSVCLFDLLSDILKEYELELIPVHVHHGIRGDEADRDEKFCMSLAHENHLEIITYHVDAPSYANEKGLTLEEAARLLRYDRLDIVARDEKADSIALAHHRDDQAETVLMNLFRGTGATGLAGIRPRSRNRIRPLLFASKREILEYLDENNITFMEDSTNFCFDHTRNRIRSELLPMIEELYPQARNHIAAAAEDVDVWRSFIEAEAEKACASGQALIGADPADVPAIDAGDMEATGRVTRIDRAFFMKEPRAIREEILRQAVAGVIPARKDVSREHYRMLIDLMESEVTGRRIDLPQGCYAQRTYDELVIGRRGPVVCGAPELSLENDRKAIVIPGRTSHLKLGEKSSFVAEFVDENIFNEEKHTFFEEKHYTKFIDYDKIENGLVLRHPEEGDYFVLDQKGGKKKLSRYYIDKKIPKDQRALSLVIADGSHVVWALPDRLSEYYKVTEDTRKVLRISREGEGVPVGKELR